MPVNRLYNVNCSRRKVNTVSRLPPVSVWLIVSREIILLTAELIPLPEEARKFSTVELLFVASGAEPRFLARVDAR